MAKGRNGAGKKNGHAKKRGGSRRSKAEDMTGAKDAAVEVRKVEAKQLELSASAIEKKPGEFRNFYNRALSDYGIYLKHQGNYRKILQEAKAANPLMADAIKLAVSLLKKDGTHDFDEIVKKLQVQGFVLMEFGSTLQLTLHDTLLGDQKDHVYKRGFERGEQGVGLDMPYPKGSDLNEIYALGWRNGQNKIMKLPFGETLETAIPVDRDAGPPEAHDPKKHAPGPDEELVSGDEDTDQDDEDAEEDASSGFDEFDEAREPAHA